MPSDRQAVLPCSATYLELDLSATQADQLVQTILSARYLQLHVCVSWKRKRPSWWSKTRFFYHATLWAELTPASLPFLSSHQLFPNIIYVTYLLSYFASISLGLIVVLLVPCTDLLLAATLT